MSRHCILAGIGRYAPETVLSNSDLEKLVDTTDEWIVTRTGIRERRIIDEGMTTADLAAKASAMAIEKAGLAPDDITHILLATLTPDSAVPPGAASLALRLGLKHIPVMDVNAACSGFLYCLDLASSIICAHPEAKVLVTASDTLSQRTNWDDRSTCILFGDASGSAVVTADQGTGKGGRILDIMLSSDPEWGPMLTVHGGYSGHPYKKGQPIDDAYFIQMQGREVYKHAVRSMTAISLDLLKRNGYTPEDVDVLVPHQANVRIIEAVGKKIGVPRPQVFVNADRYGNTSAASAPLALSEAVDHGFVKPGDLVLMTTFGGGFTWGSALLRF
jgi:3-oxoacyl-[acyl-carrier-protein] synthase-3